MALLDDIKDNLIIGKSKIVKQLVQQAVDEGLPPKSILEDGLLAGMNVVGDKFQAGEYFVPEVLVAARAMTKGVDIIKPLLVAGEDGGAAGKVCIGTFKGDLHDIGKNLVKMMMESKGLEVIDLGNDVDPQTYIDTAVNEGCNIIACSALLTTTMNNMADVVSLAEEAGIRDKVMIMVGGAAVTQTFCDKIGADKYTTDANSAAAAAVEYCAG